MTDSDAERKAGKPGFSEKQAKDFLSVVLGSLPEVIFTLDDHFRFVFVNQAVESLLGYHVDELLGQSFTRFFADAAEANEWLDHTVAHLQRREMQSGRLALKRRDGQRMTVGFAAGRSRDPDVNHFRLVGTLHDISGELEAERVLTLRNRSLATLSRITALVAEGGELRPLLEKLLLIFMQTLDLRAAAIYVAAKDQQSAVLAAHRGMPRAITDQYPTASFARPWVSKLLVRTEPIRLAAVPDLDPRVAALLREHRVENMFATPIRNKGRTSGVLLFVPVRAWSTDDNALLEAVDVQLGVAIENARLLEEIRESQAKYSTVVERANDGIMISQDNVFRFVNKRLADMLGYAVSEMIGMDITRAMPPEDRAEMIRHYEARITGKIPKEVYPGRLMMKDGRSLEVEFNAISSEYDGRPASMSFVRDIAERTRMEREIMAEKETAQFFNDVLTHDVNNFIHTILGSAELLEDPAIVATEQDRRHYFDTLKKTARRCAELIDHVRELMSIRRLEPSMFVPVPLRPAIQEAVDIVRDLSRETPFSAQVEAADNQFVLGSQLLRQVFINLVSNAVRHNSKSEKWVHIAVADNPACAGWRITVEDNGDGIPAAAKAKLYQRFARFSKKEGLGLGLSIVKALVDVMSGTIEVEDRMPGQPPEGTRVIVCFPRA